MATENTHMSAKAEALPTAESIAKYVKQNAPKSRKMMAMMHHTGGQEVIREEDYKDHHIIVRSTYHIMVDKQEVTGHLMVTNSGQVQYHGLPNHSFDSAIDLVKSLIDNFPEDFEQSKKTQGMAGMKMGGMKLPAKGAKMTGMKRAGRKSLSRSTAAKAKPKRKSK